ncbi:uncharacterized protein B0H18DRAFT_6392 [Fomitopsis serialis]|uniref:uncharacterized protein n=1 Tax=Fomitopsis serialis TaxID=139415 RepID=UPI002008A111|nr:uncharacterized protein B0H18DRAFT_6392 [Neoantrodia serialis]KAH9938192.1 hypothetical protein B0H18DRAFT_6392 [Neoantrodia serialis]
MLVSAVCAWSQILEMRMTSTSQNLAVARSSSASQLSRISCTRLTSASLLPSGPRAVPSSLPGIKACTPRGQKALLPRCARLRGWRRPSPIQAWQVNRRPPFTMPPHRNMGWRKPVPKFIPETVPLSRFSSTSFKRMSFSQLNKDMPPLPDNGLLKLGSSLSKAKRQGFVLNDQIDPRWYEQYRSHPVSFPTVEEQPSSMTSVPSSQRLARKNGARQHTARLELCDTSVPSCLKYASSFLSRRHVPLTTSPISTIDHRLRP